MMIVFQLSLYCLLFTAKPQRKGDFTGCPRVTVAEQIKSKENEK